MKDEQNKGRPIEEIEGQPLNDLATHLHKKVLGRVIRGLLLTGGALGGFAASQNPEVRERINNAIERLTDISLQAAQGKLARVNRQIYSFSDLGNAQTLFEILGPANSEPLPVPSSITRRLHSGQRVVALDGMAKASFVPGLRTVLTETTSIDDSHSSFSVRLVGSFHFPPVNPPVNPPSREPSN